MGLLRILTIIVTSFNRLKDIQTIWNKIYFSTKYTMHRRSVQNSWTWIIICNICLIGGFKGFSHLILHSNKYRSFSIKIHNICVSLEFPCGRVLNQGQTIQSGLSGFLRQCLWSDIRCTVCYYHSQNFPTSMFSLGLSPTNVKSEND